MSNKAYNIERITVHGIEVPVVNHETKGPMIAYTMLGEELGLSNRTFKVLIERKDMSMCVNKLFTHMEGATGRQRKTQEVAFIPLRKFEVLINSVNTGHIGKNLIDKDRKALVEDIEALQEEIRSVIEAYYHDGVAINEKVKTKAGNKKINGHVAKSYSKDELIALYDEIRTEGTVMISRARELAEFAISTAEVRAQKDRRTSFAKRLGEMKELFEEAKMAVVDGSVTDAHDTFLAVYEGLYEALDVSHGYRGSEMSSLRKDVRQLKKDVRELRDLFFTERDERRADRVAAIEERKDLIRMLRNEY